MSIHKLYRRDSQPFAQIPNNAIRNPKITNVGFRLLVYLMSHKDGYDLSYKQIEAETGMGRHAIQNATKNLEELGWLTTEITKLSNGQFGGKAWILNDVTSAPNSTAADSTVEKGAHYKNTNSKNTNSKKDTSDHDEIKSFYSEQFELFMQAYPKRVSKGQAWKTWQKLQADKVLPDLATLIVAANEYEKRVTDPKYRKNPSTWLNAHGWLDEPERKPEQKQQISSWGIDYRDLEQ